MYDIWPVFKENFKSHLILHRMIYQVPNYIKTQKFYSDMQLQVAALIDADKLFSDQLQSLGHFR